MPETLLRTKLFVPPLRPNLVPRLHLIKRLNQGLQLGHKLTLVSAPAGFGKTTLVSEWIASCERPAAWLSLDEGDNDPARFLAYFAAAIQTIAPNLGDGVLAALQSPQPPPTESILTILLNEIASISDSFVFVLDDYHVFDATPFDALTSVDEALTFLLEHLPPQMHLVIATREDPNLPVARLRARGQLTEIRAADLRFTSSEAAEFLNQMMGLDLSTEDIAELETRTEGWIAGLQLAAVSMQGHSDTAGFVKSFTGSHYFVLDYLVEEVLEQQSESIQTFLLQTAILDRLTGSLCNVLTGQDNGQKTLEYLERANLFLIPLDNVRRWYRYHHLFADLLRQRLHQSATPSTGAEERDVAELHIRASVWYEDNSLEIEAFHHAVAANDIERAERLVEGDGLPLSFRGVVSPVLNWLASLPTTMLDARPSLWVTYAMTMLTTGQMIGIEEKLLAAEAALQDTELDDKTRDLIGRIADIRGTMAVGQRQPETIIAQSRRALEYLHPDNLTYRATTTWKLGVAYEYQGDRAAASKAYKEAISISQASGNIYTRILATIGLGDIRRLENQLYLAADTYQRALQLVGDLPIPVAFHVDFCLARIFYEWNDIDAAQQHVQECLQQARLFKDHSDVFVACEVLLARLKLAQGDVAGATDILDQAYQLVSHHNFVRLMPDVVVAQVLTSLHQGNLALATDLVQTQEIPLSQARVHLALGDPSAAVALLGPLRWQMEAKDLKDEKLKVMVLQTVAYDALGEKDKAVQMLGDVLALAEPGGFIRIFVDEGLPMALLLREALRHGTAPDYIRRLLAAFPGEQPVQADTTTSQADLSEMVEPLSKRELEVLQRIAEGLTNREIADRLYLSLNTVKVHTRNIYGKLNVHSRTQAIARSQELGLLPRKTV